MAAPARPVRGARRGPTGASARIKNDHCVAHALTITPHPRPQSVGTWKPGARSGLGAPGFLGSHASCGFCKVSEPCAPRDQASEPPLHGSGRAARRLPVTWFPASGGRPSPPAGLAPRGAIAGLRGPRSSDHPVDLGTLPPASFAFCPRTVHGVSLERICGTHWTRLGAQCSTLLLGPAGKIVCVLVSGRWKGVDHLVSGDLREKRVECASVRACGCTCACARG